MFMITGFGISYKPDSLSATTVRDTMSAFYASIEQLELEDAHPSFDIWALGITLYTMMARKEPFTQIAVSKRIKAIL